MTVFPPMSLFLLQKLRGVPQIERECMGHTLNMKAAARKAASLCNIDYKGSNIIVAYLRSGNVVSLHSHGKMIDLVPDDEGSVFNRAERAEYRHIR